jgi:hypothetical protein
VRNDREGAPARGFGSGCLRHGGGG